MAKKGVYKIAAYLHLSGIGLAVGLCLSQEVLAWGDEKDVRLTQRPEKQGWTSLKSYEDTQATQQTDVTAKE